MTKEHLLFESNYQMTQQPESADSQKLDKDGEGKSTANRESMKKYIAGMIRKINTFFNSVFNKLHIDMYCN